MSLAEKADKIVVLENGRIVQEGSPRKLISSQGELAHHFQMVQSPVPEIV
jgi:ABC-type multidrug transport system fused ATPase/permease subunit